MMMVRTAHPTVWQDPSANAQDDREWLGLSSKVVMSMVGRAENCYLAITEVQF